MRTSAFLLGALLAAVPATAQTTFGLRAGLNVSTVSFDDDEDIFGVDGGEKQPRLGLTAGVFADVALTPALTFHPEVLYSQKGVRFNLEGDATPGSGEGAITLQIDYVEVPLLLAYRIPAGANGLVVGLEGGPTIARKVNTGYSCSGDFEPFCDLIESEGGIEDDGISDFDLGAALGLTVGAGPFGVGARVTQGITTIDDAEEGEEGEQDGMASSAAPRNQTFSLTAHYTFGR